MKVIQTKTNTHPVIKRLETNANLKNLSIQGTINFVELKTLCVYVLGLIEGEEGQS